jgi:hypothetical protein
MTWSPRMCDAHRQPTILPGVYAEDEAVERTALPAGQLREIVVRHSQPRRLAPWILAARRGPAT